MRMGASRDWVKPVVSFQFPVLSCSLVPAAGNWQLLTFQIHHSDRHVPVRVQDFEAALLLALVSLLVGEQLLLQGCLVEGLIGDSRVFEDDGHTIVPAAVFSGVIA